MESILKRFQRSLAAITLAAMGSTMIAAPAVQARLDFTDSAEVPSWAEEAIEELMDQGVISGNDDGSFAPNRQLNRAEVSKVIVLASGVEIDTTGGPHFPDVDESAWYYDYIETMYNQGWINGYPDGYFRPAVGINRAEIAKMVINAFEIDSDISGAPHFDDVSSSDWFYGYIETAYNNGLMRGYGDGSFGPANAVTRAETTKVVYDGQLVVAEPTGPAEGTLEVVLSSDTPRGTNVPFNATSVPYTTVELTASDDNDVEISSLTFTRLGLGDNDDFDNVWLEIDGFKIGNDKSINNDDVVELRFNPPVVIPAGQTIVADVVASSKYTVGTDENVGHHNRIALVSGDDIVSTAANVVGDFPVEGEEMEIADYQVSTVQLDPLGSSTTVDVGDNFIEIGKFKMENSSSTNKDVELRAVTFKNDGTAEIEDNLENVALYVSGEQVSAETIMDGDYVTFRLDNGVTGGYILEDGDSRIFSIRADIVSAERNDTITFKIDNYEDVVAVEIGTSFGVKAIDGGSGGSGCTTGTSDAEDDCATLSTYTIDSGDLNVSRDPASLGNQTYAPGSNDVTFLTARIVVDQPLIVDGLRVDVADIIDAGGGLTTDTELNAAFDNFRFYLNDRLIDSENDFTVTGTPEDAYLDFNTTFEIAGTSIIKIVGNIASDATDTDQLKLEIATASTAFSSPEYISTGDQVQSTQLLGSATGSYIEIQASTISITKTDGFSTGDKIVAGVDDVDFIKFVLDNNDSGEVNVTSVSVSGSATGSADTYTNYTAAVFVDGVQQGSAKNLDSNGDATFNDLSVIIDSAGQKEFTIVVDTMESSATSLTGGVTDANINEATPTVVTDSTLAAGLAVNDIVYVDSGDAVCTDEEVTVTAVTTTTFTYVDNVNCTAAGAADDTTFTLKHTVTLSVEDVDADNVANGDEVDVTAGGTTLATANPLAGTAFELVQSGSLTIATGSTVYSDLLVANESNVEVLKVRLNAADDEVQIRDLYLMNDTDDDGTVDYLASANADIEDRVSFKLFNESGQLIQEKTMTDGLLHFELANNDRIRVPKDDSTYVTVKVDVKDITKANQTAKRLLLTLNTATNDGAEAVTAATGSDLSTDFIAGDATGQSFVAHRTQIEVRHATSQPGFSGPSVQSQEVYRFTISADDARQAEIGRLGLDIDLAGIDKVADAELVAADFDVKLIQSNGSVDSTATVVDGTTPIEVYNETGSDNSARVFINFDNQTLSAGESRTYGLFLANTDADGTDNDDDEVSVTLIKDEAYYYDNSTSNLADQKQEAGAAAAANAGGTTTTIIIDDGDAVTAGLIDADTGATGSGSYPEAIGKYALVTDTSATDYFVVKITDTNSDGTDTTITFTPAITATVATDTVERVGALVWSDESDPSHSDTTYDWLNGYLVDIDTTAHKNED